MNSSTANGSNNIETIDTLISQYAKDLKPGESISIPLYKGKESITTIDPLQASKANKAAAAIGAKEPSKSVISRNELNFPRIMKFIETVEKPNFGKQFKDGRLYVEDIPKAKDDSDEEENPEPQPTRKKRWRRNQPAKQHWVLQTNQEYIQKFKIKQFKLKDPVGAAKLEHEMSTNLSSRYNGLPEANHSQYIILEANSQNSDGQQGLGNILVTPTHGYTNFTQPAKFKRLSMQQAEEAMSSTKLTRYMMHQNNNNIAEGAGPKVNGATTNALATKSRSRLMSKLAARDDDNDIMGDLLFREPTNRSTTNEMLKGIGDADIKIDAEGILGGANDSEFGGKRRFGRMGGVQKEEGNNSNKKSKGGGGGKGDVAGEAVAMQDDFYQRDVGAEYDELDYDPNEQFDDDDVDVGAEEVVMDDGGGFAADIDDSDSEDEEDEDGSELDMTGFSSGFATSAGMKAMIAKANGEEIQPPIAVAPVAPLDKKSNFSDANATSGSDRSEDEFPTGKDAGKNGDQSGSGASRTSAQAGSSGVQQLDENGLRVITKEAVRREIWLHNGSIAMRKLAKVYNVSGKSDKERQERFKTICRELCNMSAGKLILKQHYSRMD